MNKFAEKNDFLRDIFDVMPIPVLIVDSDVQILFSNKMGTGLFGIDKEEAHTRKTGEALICENSLEKGCGLSVFCNDCVLRNSANEAIKGKGVLRRKTKMKFLRGDELKQVNLLVTATPFEYEGQTLALLMVEDISELIRLRSFLPICASCKKIRDDKGMWEEVEQYIEAHIDVDFSHAICPACAKKLYPDLYEEEK